MNKERLLPWIIELNEGKRRPTLVLQVNEVDLSELVEEILDVLGTNVWWKVSDVDTALVVVAVSRHRFTQNQPRQLPILTKRVSTVAGGTL